MFSNVESFVTNHTSSSKSDDEFLGYADSQGSPFKENEHSLTIRFVLAVARWSRKGLPRLTMKAYECEREKIWRPVFWCGNWNFLKVTWQVYNQDSHPALVLQIHPLHWTEHSLDLNPLHAIPMTSSSSLRVMSQFQNRVNRVTGKKCCTFIKYHFLFEDGGHSFLLVWNPK